jgi:molybdopterin converting factor subunit 1
LFFLPKKAPDLGALYLGFFMQRITIQLFGITRDITGQHQLELGLEAGLTSESLLRQLCQQYPALGRLSSLVVAINEEYALPDQLIQPGDTLALIPPVAGG